MELSVVVPARNAAATLGEQLDALLAQEWSGRWEVVVVDNGSSDGTAALVQRYERCHPRVRLVHAGGGTGAAWVRNLGLRNATAEAVAFCDADDVVGPGWVAAMGDALREHDCVTGPVDVESLNPAWLARTRGASIVERPSTFYGFFPIVPAGNAGFRRGVLDLVGCFDESVVANEDVDLSMRLWRAGIPVHFAPGAVIEYRYRTGGRDLWRQGRAYGAYRPLVCRRLRDLGYRPPRFAGWRSWGLLLLWLPRLTNHEGRAAWLWVAGNRIGQLEGSVRYRTVAL